MSNNVNNLYTKPARSNTGSLVLGQSLTVDATAGGVQFAGYTNAQCLTVEVDLQTAAVWVTFDGSTPSSSNGHSINPGQCFTWSCDRFNGAKFIRQGATSGFMFASPSQI